ncbi:MAG: hypothetical protein E2576_22795 [Alcaligenaceae bacterium]|nr:hypothetical protein [Alcaligenaceae bacterium SAGV5]MPS50890.1 hypothetical protein [Alcaligenaceae bacterium SAGV3]MPT59560.1 hypothetical protein [Alcaligenaceae bacterium]
MILFRNLLLGVGASLLMASCGGGGGGDDGGTSTPADRPAAVARADAQTVPAGQPVMLDGSASSTPNGGTLAYLWSIDQRPDGSTATLSDERVAQPVFAPDRAGAYRISLVVDDGKARSAPALLDLRATSVDPVAVVTPQVSQLLASTVQLDGSASLPPEGGSAAGIAYAWTLAEKPEGSQAALDDPRIAQPRFVADKVGAYRAVLTVSYGSRVSAPAAVTITIGVANSRPVPNAGSDIAGAVRGTRIVLDGSASTDADGDPLQYRWRFASRPYGSQAVIDAAASARASFVPDFAGTYRINLSLFDGQSTSLTPATITVQVVPPAGAPNTKPIAVITAPFGKTFEAERGTSISLTGAYSIDAEDGMIASAAREWTLLSAPEGFDRAANWKGTSFIGTHYGNYLVQLRVQDSHGAWSDAATQAYTVVNGANRPPRAIAKVAGAGNSVGVGGTVTLTGEDSIDPDGNRLTYKWTLLDRPDGSSATLSNANAVNASFVADKAGPYLFSLLVTDEHGFPSSDGISVNPVELTVVARTRNQPPIARLVAKEFLGNANSAILATANYSAEQPMVLGEFMAANSWGAGEFMQWNSFLLEPNGYDPDGDAITYLWTLPQSPAEARFAMPLASHFCAANAGNYPGASVIGFQDWMNAGLALRQWSCNRLGLAPMTAGKYQVQLALSDGIDIAGPYTLDLYAVDRANYPSLLLEDLRTHHQWSNGDQMLINRQDADAKAFQRFFPFDGFGPTLPGTLGLDSFRGDLVVKTFRLTAYGGDYTIADLRAVDAGGTETPKFVGLANNQVIRRGESVEFQLVWPITATPPGTGGVVAGRDGMTWSFRVAGKDGWTFSYNPTNNYNNNY